MEWYHTYETYDPISSGIFPLVNVPKETAMVPAAGTTFRVGEGHPGGLPLDAAPDRGCVPRVHPRGRCLRQAQGRAFGPSL